MDHIEKLITAIESSPLYEVALAEICADIPMTDDEMQLVALAAVRYLMVHAWLRGVGWSLANPPSI